MARQAELREFEGRCLHGLGTQGAAANTYLSCARNISHDGSCPMSTILALDRPMPAKYLKKISKLVAG